MKRLASLRHLSIPALLGVVLIAYLPQLHEFVGTDIGVYYEIGRRLATDGRLELWGNYWDHKPPLIYLFFALFSHLDAWLGDTAGLKYGTLAGYAGLTLLVYRALSGSRPAEGRILATLGSATCASLILGWLDPVANGILMVGALLCAFSGLVLCVDGRRDASTLLGGALVGLAPFLRPTALTALPFMLVLLVVADRTPDGKRRLGLSLGGCIMVAVTCALWLLSFGGTAVFDSLIHYNADYGSRARSATPLPDFFLQDPLALTLAGCLLAGSLVFVVRAESPRRLKSAILLAWALTEVLSIVFQRKIQSFYVFGFLLPLLLTFVYSAAQTTRPFRMAASAALALMLAGTLGYSWNRVDLRVFQNPLVSQRTQKTQSVVEAMVAQGCRGTPREVLVYGNRAQIYTLAASEGIRPYAWSVFLNPVVDGSIFADRQHQLLESLATRPASFIVYVGTPGWSPNIGGRIAGLEALIERAYVEVPIPPVSGLESPYNYHYRLYRHIDCNA